MGILNVTPDSFAERQPASIPIAPADAALAMAAAGADIIDIGGESTRPGAEPVAEEEELRRVLPVLRRLAGRLTVPVSIDTYKARRRACGNRRGGGDRERRQRPAVRQRRLRRPWRRRARRSC